MEPAHLRRLLEDRLSSTSETMTTKDVLQNMLPEGISLAKMQSLLTTDHPESRLE